MAKRAVAAYQAALDGAQDLETAKAASRSTDVEVRLIEVGSKTTPLVLMFRRASLQWLQAAIQICTTSRDGLLTVASSNDSSEFKVSMSWDDRFPYFPARTWDMQPLAITST